ncbi:MAG: hypothetical protein Q8O67_21425 [Deltaproteobacteria bacterium]|nr:hypothetical protein [Deltaproteobacteria bacterium]
MNLLNSALAVAGIAVLAACSTTTTLAPTNANPASEGKVRVSEGPNGNTKVEVTLDHLPNPRALDPTYATYVVWIKPDERGQFMNMGQVAINDEREGRLETITPLHRFTLVVTAEPDATATTPSGAIMLRGDVERSSPRRARN